MVPAADGLIGLKEKLVGQRAEIRRRRGCDEIQQLHLHTAVCGLMFCGHYFVFRKIEMMMSCP